MTYALNLLRYDPEIIEPLYPMVYKLRKEDPMRLARALFILISLLVGVVMTANATQIYGYVEKVSFPDKDLTLSAKLDTGAKSASLNAINISETKVNGIPYLRFTVPTKNGDFTFECEYKGRVRIKVREGEHGTPTTQNMPIRRPVVLMKMQLGEQVKFVKVNLTNRKRFNYPLLLGRDAIIAFDGAVNPALTFTVKPKSSSK